MRWCFLRREGSDLEEEGDRGIVDSEVQDENFAPIRLQEGDFAKCWAKVELAGGRQFHNTRGFV